MWTSYNHVLGTPSELLDVWTIVSQRHRTTIKALLPWFHMWDWVKVLQENHKSTLQFPNTSCIVLNIKCTSLFNSHHVHLLKKNLWYKVLLEKLISYLADQEMPSFKRNWRVILKSQPLVPTPSQVNSIHTLFFHPCLIFPYPKCCMDL